MGRQSRAALSSVGCAIFSQTDDIAPADKVLYALRDVTATVDSLPLITASIMSKKIAEGVGALVLDVKTGAGAFMRDERDAQRLAESMVNAGTRAGVRTEALITSMDAPLGCAVGNALEVVESVEVLRGRGPADLRELCLALATRMLVVAGLCDGETTARDRVERALDPAPRWRGSAGWSPPRAVTLALSTTRRACRRRRTPGASRRHRRGSWRL